MTSLNLPHLYRFCSQLTIQGRDEGFIRMARLYGTQRYLFERIEAGLERGIHEFVPLKGRQEGITTACDALALYYPQMYPGLNGMFVSNDDDNRDYRRDLIRQMHASLPKGFKWKLRMDNRTTLAWGAPNSSRLMFASSSTRSKRPGQASLGMSRGMNFLIGDEVAAWEDLTAIGKVRASLSKRHPHRLYIWNSTARGHGVFREMYQTAERAVTQEAIFVGWWRHEDYEIPLPVRPDDPAQLVDYQNRRDLWERYGGDPTAAEREWMTEVFDRYDVTITAPQLVWYRWQLAEEFSGDESMLAQEFPCTPEQAWVAFGEHFIPAGTIRVLKRNLVGAPRPTGYAYDWPEHIERLDVHRADAALADLRVWEEPQPDGVYVVACHPARSSHPNARMNVAYVFRAYRESLIQVAEYGSEDVEMYRFAWACFHLAGAYRRRLPAFLCVEVQATGEYVLREMQRVENFGLGFTVRPPQELVSVARAWTSVTHYLYRRADSVSGRSFALHMRTGAAQIAWLMLGMRNALERRQVVIRSEALIDELMWLRRGEHGDFDVVSTGGNVPGGRAHALALAVETWLSTAMPHVQRLVPAQATGGDPETVGQELVRDFLHTQVLAGPKPMGRRPV